MKKAKGEATMRITKRALLAQSAAIAAIAASAPAFAQDEEAAATAEGEGNVIVVTGFKRSLQVQILPKS